MLRYFLILFLALPFYSYSQTISGRITDLNGLAVEYAEVVLKSTEGKIIFSATSGSDGKWQGNIPAGSYTLYIYQFSQEQYAKSIVITKDADVGDIQIKGALGIDEVVVEHKKKMILKTGDKLVMRVEDNPLFKGKNTFEILRYAPYVWIDGSSETITIKQNSTAVWINGKPSNMTQDVLNNYLKSLSNEEIKSIEIITNPSSRYSAAGGSIINIITKNATKKGLNAVVTSVTSVSRFINSYNAFQVNSLISEKFSVSAFYVNNNSKSMREEDRREQLFVPQVEYDYKKQDTIKNKYNYASASFLYDINKKNQAGLNFYYINSDGSNAQNNDLTITDDNITKSIGDYLSASKSKNYNASFNYAYKPTDTKALTTILDFYRSDNESNNTYYNTFFNEQNQLEDLNRRRSYSPAENNIFSAQVDYETNIGKARIEFGGRYSFVKNTNKTLFENEVGGIFVPDANFTNDFNYKEQVTASYLSFRQDSIFKTGFSLQAGLRAEYTDGRGIMPSAGYDKSRNYLNLFPSVFLNKNLENNTSLGLSYSRRISRPSYNSFNPTIFYLTDFTSSVGNPDLQPSYTNAFEATYNSQGLNLMAYYNQIEGESREILKRLSDTELRYQWQNIDYTKQFGISASANKKINNWLEVFANASWYNKIYRSGFLDADNIDVSKGTFQGRIVTAFTFSNTLRSDVSFEYNGPETYGQFDSGKNYAFYLNVSKKVNDRLSLYLKVVDPFDNLRYSFTNNQTEIRTSQYRNNFSRTISIYCVINFATGQNTKSIQIKNSNQEFKNRTN